MGNIILESFPFQFDKIFSENPPCIIYMKNSLPAANKGKMILRLPHFPQTHVPLWGAYIITMPACLASTLKAL